MNSRKSGKSLAISLTFNIVMSKLDFLFARMDYLQPLWL